MNERSTPLAPLFRSESQMRLLGELFTPERAEMSVGQLAEACDVSQPTASRELARLEDFGVVVSRLVGRTRLVSANWQQPWAHDLEALLAKTIGLPARIARALAPVEGIASAYIFGSWAARFAGEPGPAPRDVDVVVVGDADLDGVRSACREVEREAKIEINAIVVGSKRWQRPSKEDGFILELKARPLLGLRVST